MNRRPFSITVTGWIFVGSGVVMTLASVVSVIKPLSSMDAPHLQEEGLAFVIQVVALIGGAFLLRGFNWARWLLVGWTAYHVVLSLFHPIFELIVHSLLFITLVFILFRQQATAYFGRSSVG